MSLYGSLRTGVSGLRANAQRIAMISDNISNLNTVGYKRAEAEFSTFLTSNTIGYTSGGIRATALRNIDQQGTIEISNSSTDFAISGKGYFVVSDALAFDEETGEFSPGGSVFYTRSGQFKPDSDGNLRNVNGYYLLSWPRNGADTDFVQAAELANLSPVNVNSRNIQPSATDEVELSLNLTTRTPTGSDEAYHVRQVVYDRQGTPRNLELVYERISQVGPAKTMFFNDGNEFEVDYNLTQPDHWRAYAKVDDAQVLSYFEDGTINRGESGLVAIADLVFDKAGNLDTMLPPGAVTEYMQTKLPYRFNEPDGTLQVEAGFETGEAIDLRTTANNGPRTLVEMRAMGAILERYTTGLTFSNPPTTAEIVAGLTALDTTANPSAMLEIYRSLSGEILVANANRGDDSGVPDVLDSSIGDYNNYNNRFGVPLFGETSGRFSGGRFVDVSGNIQYDDVGLVKHTDNGAERLRITIDYNSDLATAEDRVELDLNFGSMNFSALQAGGVLNSTATDLETVNPGTGADGITSFYDEVSTINSSEQNGRQFSSLSTVSVNRNGVISGNYSNGELRDLYQVPLALFANPNGMIARSGNAYAISEDSGLPTLAEADSGTSGTIRGSALESSAVDVAQEFSDMIVTQRGYSASTKVISAADEMLRELASIR